MTKLEAFILGVVSWLTPLFPFFIMAGVAVSFDTYYGVKVAKKNKDFKSRRFARVIYKFFIYNIIIISGFAVDKYLIGVFIDHYSNVELTITRALVFGVLLVEMVSIDEKLRMLNGKGFRYYWKKVMGVLFTLNKTKNDLGL